MISRITIPATYINITRALIMKKSSKIWNKKNPNAMNNTINIIFFCSSFTGISVIFIKYIENDMTINDIQVEYAAPIAPCLGIRRKHRMTFVTAPINLVQAAYFGKSCKNIPGVCSK